MTNPYSEHIKMARGQLRRLETMQRNIDDMSANWDDVDNGVVGDFDHLSEQINRQVKQLQELMADWQRAREWE